MDGGSLHIRPARASEAPALTSLAFRSKASNGYDAAFMAACRAELTFDAESIASGETWLCEEGSGSILGFFDLRREADTAEGYALFVEPEAKGHGVGRALWTKIEERASALGAAEIGVDSDPQAVPFYVRMGMHRIGEAPSGSIPGRMLPRLRKALASPPSRTI